MSKQELAKMVMATMQKAAKSVCDVKILGRFVHVSFTNAADSNTVQSMLSAMSSEVRVIQPGRDGVHLSGFKGHRMTGVI